MGFIFDLDRAKLHLTEVQRARSPTDMIQNLDAAAA